MFEKGNSQLSDSDYVYVAFTSIEGCKISIKLKVTGEYTKGFKIN